MEFIKDALRKLWDSSGIINLDAFFFTAIRALDSPNNTWIKENLTCANKFLEVLNNKIGKMTEVKFISGGKLNGVKKIGCR